MWLHICYRNLHTFAVSLANGANLFVAKRVCCTGSIPDGIDCSFVGFLGPRLAPVRVFAFNEDIEVPLRTLYLEEVSNKK